MKVLGISGSLRSESHNTALLRAAASALPSAVELELYDGLAEIPAFNQDFERNPPESVRRLKRAIADADAVLFSTPEYNHSLPGQLKNALDWVSRPLGDSPLQKKPVAVVGASTGTFGAVWAQAELRKVLEAIEARVVDRELPLANADDAFAPDGSLMESEIATALGEITDELLEELAPQLIAA